MDKHDYKKLILSQPYQNVIVLSGRIKSKRHIPTGNNLPLCKKRIKKNEVWQTELNKPDCKQCLKLNSSTNL